MYICICKYIHAADVYLPLLKLSSTVYYVTVEVIIMQDGSLVV